MKTITLRMTLKTYKRLRRNFKAKRKESAASYFERLSHVIEDWKPTFDMVSLGKDGHGYNTKEGDKVINGHTPSIEYSKEKGIYLK